ncbi:MAG: hypothetical protein AAB425_08625 [Bdellovibrionota bacterium]
MKKVTVGAVLEKADVLTRFLAKGEAYEDRVSTYSPPAGWPLQTPVCSETEFSAPLRASKIRMGQSKPARF